MMQTVIKNRIGLNFAIRTGERSLGSEDVANP